MNGHMAEAHNGSAVLEDVDPDTFVRFAQWAYQGYYIAANSTVEVELLSESENGEIHDRDSGRRRIAEPERETEPLLEVEEQPATYAWGQPVKHKSSKKASKRSVGLVFRTPSLVSRNTQETKQGMKEAFINREHTARQESIRIPPPLPNRHHDEDYTEVFLCHARLYVFADKYDVQPLRVLALEELQATLAIFTLYLQRTTDIITLLRYVYAHYNEVEEEEMRMMLMHYIGYEMDTLMKDEDFRCLMIEDGGALLADFMGMVEQRLS